MPGKHTEPFRLAAQKLEASHDVPYLLGQITALTSENKRLRKELQQWEEGLKTPPWTRLVPVDDAMSH